MRCLQALVLAGLLGVLTVSAEGRGGGEKPAPPARGDRPPWQRLLQGEDARQAAAQTRQLEQLQTAGKFADALEVAQVLAELRSKSQGADHWEAVDARWQVKALRRVLRQDERGRSDYLRSPSLMSQAVALRSKGRYKEAQPLLEEVLAVYRKVLGEKDPATAAGYNNLAFVLYAQGKYAAAEALLRKALAINRKGLGEQHPNTAQSYTNVALLLKAQGKFAEAEPLYHKALAIWQTVLGEEHPTTARGYNNLALNHYAQEKYAEAETLSRKALDINRKVLGEEHRETAQGYANVAFYLMAQGKYVEAEPLYRKVLAIRQKLSGGEHLDTAASYYDLALNLHQQGKYAKAEPLFRKALAIYRKVLGEEHRFTALSYNKLATTLSEQGKYAEAESLYRKALAIRQKLLGEEHPNTAVSYNNLALNLNAQGKYTEAEAIYRKALALLRKVSGEEHPNTATTYNNLASNLEDQGKYAEAEPLYHKALAIQRKVLGEEHPDTSITYSNLGHNLNEQGKYAEAEPLIRKALAIRRKVLGEEHPHTAVGYNNLAAYLRDQGKYAEAEPLFQKALAIQRKVLGEEHPHTAQSYENLAGNLQAQGQYAAAEPLFRKALVIRRKVLGEEHPDTATSYNNVALNLNAQGRYAEAEPLYRKALTICQKVLGEEYPTTARGYSNLAYNLYEQGKYAEAERLWQRCANSFARLRLRIAAAGLDRAAKTGENSPLPSLAAVLARNGKPDEAWQRFEESLARGTWDDLSARLRRPAAEQARQAQLVARLNRLDQRLGRLSTVKKPTPAQTQRRQELLTQRRQSQDALDAFGQHLEKTYGPAAGQVFDRKQIQAPLPPDAALLAWIDIAGAPKAHDPNGEHWAVLLRSAGDPVFVRLKGSDPKDAWTDADTDLPAQLRTALQSARGDWQPLARRLRQQRLQPLMPHLTARGQLPAVKHLLVLPSTALAGVPVEVFAEGYTVSYALSGTFYAHLRKQPKPDSTSLLALGDPVFDLPAVTDKPLPLPPGGVLLTVVAPGSNAARARLQANDVLLRYGDTDLKELADLLKALSQPGRKGDVAVTVWREGKTFVRHVQPGKLGVVLAREPAPKALAERRKQDRQLASALRGGDDKWDALPGTRAEVEALRRLFDGKPRLLFDSQASEQRLDELAAAGELGQYRYLHLATHGIVDNRFPLNSAVILSRDALPDPNKQLDAGLPIYNGKLTVRAVLVRWHLKSELVTLSACQTALGKYERGEGFIGFAQALILAGSRSVCLSLWKVDDAATALLMEHFYQNLLGKRAGLKRPLSKAQALAEAKAWLRGLSREEALKRMAGLTEGVARGKGRPVKQLLPPLPRGDKEDRPYAHPYYWAAFVLLGDPE